MMSGCLGGDPAAETVAGEDNVLCVDAEPGGVGGIFKIGENGVGVFEIVGEAVTTGTAPGAAIVECDGVPTEAACGLREIEVLLVAGETVARSRWCDADLDLTACR